MITKKQNLNVLASLAAMAGIIPPSCPIGHEERFAEGFAAGETFSLPDMQKEKILPCSLLSAFKDGSDPETDEKRVTEHCPEPCCNNDNFHPFLVFA